MGAVDFGFAAGDTVLITGAGSGIGRATARHAAELGLAVSLWDLNPAGLAETADEVRTTAAAVHTWAADVSDDAAVDAGFTDAVRTLGPIRYLHNNAGPASSSDIPFDRALEICVGSVRRMTDTWAATGPGEGAAMVATTSVAGNLVGTDNAWYSASKAAIMGYIRHLAAHRATEFRSNGVAPGMTDTPRLAGFAGSETGQRVLTRIPLKRMATPDDIAWATLFLLSPLAGYINGVFLPVDGGWTVTQ
ncbi:SDR family oxidoreductase [Microbacterium sp. Se63.02b]|uniref:SDR family NAD(P)-dependent oxidoreductase n=1 Tax=Microbacterium sp. Se63.02b TaxID=2709304 RepID=UPI001604FA3F|nr:SDR family oxidoreductase [Microbacterium sp. Se63.02b]QNA93699.1 SDR family oxidoreductase [Microbacterium sp. Se63.02b]